MCSSDLFQTKLWQHAQEAGFGYVITYFPELDPTAAPVKEMYEGNNVKLGSNVHMDLTLWQTQEEQTYFDWSDWTNLPAERRHVFVEFKVRDAF